MAAVSQQLKLQLDAQKKSEDALRVNPDPKLRALLKNTTLKHRSENYLGLMSCSDVLAAIMEQNDSFAADTLRDYGYSLARALESANEHFLAVQKNANAEQRCLIINPHHRHPISRTYMTRTVAYCDPIAIKECGIV